MVVSRRVGPFRERLEIYGSRNRRWGCEFKRGGSVRHSVGCTGKPAIVEEIPAIDVIVAEGHGPRRWRIVSQSTVLPAAELDRIRIYDNAKQQTSGLSTFRFPVDCVPLALPVLWLVAARALANED